jgi:gluconolactonase
VPRSYCVSRAAAGGTLLLSHLQDPSGPQGLQSSEILRFTPPATFSTLVPDSGSNGLAVTADGSAVLAATHDDRSVSAFRLSDGARSTVAAGPPGHAFNSPNDLTVADDGTVYFTDPSFQR